MLDIITDVTPQAVRDALHTHVPLWGVLFLRLPYGAFPDEGWIDAINVCLPNWFADARSLAYGMVDEICGEFNEEAPRFQFRVRISQPEHVRLTCHEWGQQAAEPLELPLSTYTAALAGAGRTILKRVEPLAGPTSSLVDELKRSIAFFTA